MRHLIFIISVLVSSCQSTHQKEDHSTNRSLNEPTYELVWQDEFDKGDKPDLADWTYETGFVRNRELQLYQTDNTSLEDGVLIIEGRREQVTNPEYNQSSDSWKKNRPFAEYTSSSINTKGKHSWLYGIFEIRARIDTARGMWPAIWTLGIEKRWPANGEIDIMEFYRIDEVPTILANAAWADEKMNSVWDNAKFNLSHFTQQDPNWEEKFHIWKMDWTSEYIKLYLDDELLNEVDLRMTLNADGFNPFHQPHYILLNLAIGSNGSDPSLTSFPRIYEVDYVRVYQQAE